MNLSTAFGIQINGEFLDLQPNSKFQIELRSPAYFAGDEDIIKSSYIQSQELPRTPHNLRLLSHPERLDSADSFLKGIPCSFWWRGIEIYKGYLSVISYLMIQMSIEINPKFAETNLQDLQLGYFQFGTDGIATATDTLYNPNNYDAIFPQILNPDGSTDVVIEYIEGSFYQNSWRYYAEVNGIPASEYMDLNARITPQIKVSSAFAKIFQAFGFTTVNNFQITKELKSLLLYNNARLTPSDIVGNFKYSEMLPNRKVGDFLKAICRTFNLFLDIDNLKKEVIIEKFDDILNAEPAYDWTDKVIAEPKREFFLDKLPYSLGFKSDGNLMADKATFYQSYPITQDNYNSPIDIRSPEGFYQDSYTSLRFWYKKFPRTGLSIGSGITGKLIMRELLDLSPLNYAGDKNFEFDISPLLGARIYSDIDGNDHFAASCNVPNQAGFPLTINTAPFKLFFYRGFVTNENGYHYPLASGEKIDYNNKPIQVATGSSEFAQEELKWSGIDGLFERYWRNWWNILLKNEIISVQAALSPTDMQNFRFRHKIKLYNINVLTKRIVFTISDTSDFATADIEFVKTF